jgi:hypothetical protein
MVQQHLSKRYVNRQKLVVLLNARFGTSGYSVEVRTDGNSAGESIILTRRRRRGKMRIF